MTQKAKAGKGDSISNDKFWNYKDSVNLKRKNEEVLLRKYSTWLTSIIEYESIPSPSIHTPAARHIALNSKHATWALPLIDLFLVSFLFDLLWYKVLLRYFQYFPCWSAAQVNYTATSTGMKRAFQRFSTFWVPLIPRMLRISIALQKISPSSQGDQRSLQN